MNSIPVIILLLVISLCFGAIVNIESNYYDVNDIKVDLNTDSAWAYEEKSDEREQKMQLKTTNLKDLFDDLLGYIGEFLINPVATIGCLNQRTRNAFKSSWSLKYYVNLRFNIPHILNVKDDEPELAYILNYTWCRNDHYILLIHLMEDLLRGKKHFKVLFRPLISFVVRIFKGLSKEKREIYENYLLSRTQYSFNVNLGRIYARYDHYELAFEALKAYPRILIICFSKIESIFPDLLRVNYKLAVKYKNILLRHEFANDEVIEFKSLKHIYI